MAFKIDIEHLGRFLTFGPRFKGEVGKDIFAAKIALGLLRPIPSSGEIEVDSEQTEVSFDPNIPMDEQRWFDCATGLGVDLKKATSFDTTLENALLSYQVKNQFLITSYYFEKFGFLKLLNTATSDETIFEAEVASQIAVAMGLFESELRTLGEATIAVLHGWIPGTRLSENTSYTHDSITYTDAGVPSSNQLHVVYDLVGSDMARNLLDPQYPQNFQDLVEQGIAIPGSLEFDSPVSYNDFESNRAWGLIKENSESPQINFAYGSLQYYPILTAKSRLYNAATQVIEYYLENDLFSQTLSRDEIDRQARRAIYPDPFFSEDIFIIDGTRLGIYTDTEYFLSADSNLPPSEPTQDTLSLLEEVALKKALDKARKPEIWYFLKDDLDFREVYFSSAPAEPGSAASFGPNHDKEYPSEITLNMSASVRKNYGDLYPSDPFSAEVFRMKYYWVLTTDQIIEELGQGQTKVQHYSVIENQGNTQPLISFKEFITPSLRPGQCYRALFEINRQKFELISDGESLRSEESQESDAANRDPTPENVCLDQNSAQAERAYEEYRAHAIKRRRELVRKIREIVQTQTLDGPTNVDMGLFGDLDLDFGLLNLNNLNMAGASDYEVISRVAQALPGQEIVDFISGFTASTKDRKLNDPNNDTNNLLITVEDLKKRVDKAVEDLKEAQDIIARERIKFIKGTDFDGHNEATQLSSFFTELISREFGKGYKNLSKSELETEFTFKFKPVGIGALGHKSGKDVIEFIGQANFDPAQSELKAMFPRPRTNNYLSMIKDMTAAPKFSGFFDDSRNSCKDLGIDIDKITAYAFVTKYTSGLKPAARVEDDFSFKSWFEDNIADPIKEFGDESGQNFMDSFDADNFPEDAALRALGKECDLEKVWLGALDKLDLVSLLCDYIKCIKLPPFDFKAPNFQLPPLPKTPILGWYAGFYNFVKDNWESILKRLACTASKIIIDKLAFPFCEEQLQDFIQNDLSSENPYARQAVIEALTRTGVPDADKAKDFFDASANILTGKELCYILQGNMPDDATMASIMRLAQANGITTYLETTEDVINFFGVIGVYLPSEICDELSNQTNLRPTNCDDTNDLLRGVRNRLQTGDNTLSDEEINRVVSLAEQSKQEEADRLKAFLDNGFEGSVPPIFQFGNENSPMSDFPEHFKREQEKTAEAIFSPAKKSYGEGLAQYVPAMYVGGPLDLWPYDSRYDQIEVLRLEAALQQLQDYSESMPEEVEGVVLGEPPGLPAQWSTLHRLYQTEVIKEMPAFLISSDKRQDLELVPNTEGTTNERYKVPHRTPRLSYRRLGGGVEFRDTRGALVHKRMIKPSEDQIGFQNMQQEIESLNVIIARYNQRINRINSSGKKARLRGERNAVIDRRDIIQAQIDDADGEEVSRSLDSNIVSYEFYVLYRQNYNDENFKKLGYEFVLAPYFEPESGLYSMTYEFSSLYPTDHNSGFVQTHDLVTPGNYANNAANRFNTQEGNKIATNTMMSQWFITKTGLPDAGAAAADVYAAAFELINERLENLQTRIIQIITNKPPIIDQELFPGLQEMIDQETIIERDSQILQGIPRPVENTFTIQFKGSSVYSPKITLREIEANEDKDRFDIIVEGDFFIGLDVGGALFENTQGEMQYPAGREPGTKIFNYCNQLPSSDLLPRRSYSSGESSSILSKRYRLQNMILRKFGNLSRQFQLIVDSPPDDNEFLRSLESGEYYKSIMESIIESLIDEMSDSYLFEGEDVDLLDRRVAGKRQISHCVSNRFSFGAGSVVSFDKVVLGDVSMEIAKEMAKPENSPENYDFDSPSAFDKAMQNLAFRGFVRACLIDILLKGGLAYSIWDMEPIIEEEFFIDYAIAHVRNELDSSSELKDSWDRNIETVMNVSNSRIALDLLVRQELVKLPNYSKQVFNPNDNNTNFYNWFVERKIKHFHVQPFEELYRTGGALVADYDNRVYRDDTQVTFAKDKKSFVAEHYIQITGKRLMKLYLTKMIGMFPWLQSERDLEEGVDHLVQPKAIILNIKEFRKISTELPAQELNQELRNPENEISQGIRIVLVSTSPSENTTEALVLLANRPDGSGGFAMQFASAFSKCFNVSYRRADLQQRAATSLPVVEYNRVLDFEDCYSIQNYGVEQFQRAIPFMIQELVKQEDYIMLLENIFPIRRLMAMTSIFATGVVSGYSTMPGIMTATKSALASLVKTVGLGRTQRAKLQSISQEEFVKQLTENFPADQTDCVEFPSGLEDMFRKFFEELWKLIKQMPSIVFRGVANQIDPAYKEMRQHYINCDIKNLTYRGLQPAKTTEYKLTNGLYLKGRTSIPNGGIRGRALRDSNELAGQNNGKYVPLALGLTSDFVYSFFPLKDFDWVRFAQRLGITVSKLVTYIYSSNRPFLDPSFYFKIPCADIDVGAWRDTGKYDAGLFGRYGHPLSPFTLLALATPQLEADKRSKENNCEDPRPDCIELDTGLVGSIPEEPREPRENYHYTPVHTDPDTMVCRPWTLRDIIAVNALLDEYQEYIDARQRVEDRWEELGEDRENYAYYITEVFEGWNSIANYRNHRTDTYDDGHRIPPVRLLVDTAITPAYAVGAGMVSWSSNSTGLEKFHRVVLRFRSQNHRDLMGTDDQNDSLNRWPYNQYGVMIADFNSGGYGDRCSTCAFPTEKYGGGPAGTYDLFYNTWQEYGARLKAQKDFFAVIKAEIEFRCNAFDAGGQEEGDISRILDFASAEGITLLEPGVIYNLDGSPIND